MWPFRAQKQSFMSSACAQLPLPTNMRANRLERARSRQLNFLRLLVPVLNMSAETPVSNHAPPSQLLARKLNIVFILVDNLGYGELGVYGGGILRWSGNAAGRSDGCRRIPITNFNVEAQSTPSRSALSTGLQCAPVNDRYRLALPGKLEIRTALRRSCALTHTRHFGRTVCCATQ
jgi:hypothetical protein